MSLEASPERRTAFPDSRFPPPTPPTPLAHPHRPPSASIEPFPPGVPSMKRPLSVALRCALSLGVLAALPLAAAAQSGERPEVAAAAAKIKADVVAWRRDFHRHPELSNR